MLTWTKAHETGSARLDQQHRLLIEQINLLEENLQNSNPTREECEFAIHLADYLEGYAEVHFKAEEECMERYRCPAHAQNQQEHKQFQEFIRDYKKRCELEGFRTELLRKLHAHMRAWIMGHILKVDLQLKPYIEKSQSASGAIEG